MSISVKSLLAKKEGLVNLCECHDSVSREIIRTTLGANGEMFAGLWISGLTQTTHLGVPDTELISPLKRASMIEVPHDDVLGPQDQKRRPLCTAFDADSGGEAHEIPALVAVLALKGVSMIIIEDKAMAQPGMKVNSLLSSSGDQAQADPHEFARVLAAFKQAAKGTEMMITARIESLTTRVGPKNATPEQEAASVQAAIDAALKRAAIYRDEGGADAIMIHSKSKEPDEVLSFLKDFRASDPHTPLVVVPTTYSKTTKTTLYETGANVIIYANHLMRAKIGAVAPVTQTLLAQKPTLFANDSSLQSCVEAQNYSCLLQRLAEREVPGEGLPEDYKAYQTIAENCAVDNMKMVTQSLVDGPLAGCEADDRIIPVKELLKINAEQVTVC